MSRWLSLPVLDLRGRAVLVTGASGPLGRQLVIALLRHGAVVHAGTRHPVISKILQLAGAKSFALDLGDSASISSALDQCSIVYHLAAQYEGALSTLESVNVDGTRRLAELAFRMKIDRLVHVSTVFVQAAEAARHAGGSESLLNLIDPYVDSKKSAERMLNALIQRTGLPAVIARPANIYGPPGIDGIGRTIRFARARAAGQAAGGRLQVRPIYVNEMVNGLILCAERGRSGQTYVFCGPEEITLEEFIRRLSLVEHQRPGLAAQPIRVRGAAVANLIGRVVPRSRVRYAAPLYTWTKDQISKTAEDLGFSAIVTLSDGMQRVQESFADANDILIPG
jgi:2-alkyl-3-oxoalkanoate reductase